MILQKLERTLDTTRKGSDLGIESRIEIIGSWGYESVLKANWEGPKCHAKDFIKIWGREPMAIVWVRAEQDSNRGSGVVYTCFQFVCPHLLGSPLDHTTKAALFRITSDLHVAMPAEQCWYLSYLAYKHQLTLDHSLPLKILSSLDFQKISLSRFFSYFIVFCF